MEFGLVEIWTKISRRTMEHRKGKTVMFSLFEHGSKEKDCRRSEPCIVHGCQPNQHRLLQRVLVNIPVHGPPASAEQPRRITT